jgi:hypothetical protein
MDGQLRRGAKRKTWLDAERRQIDLDPIKRRLVDSGEVADAVDRAAAIILGALDRIEDYADDIFPLRSAEPAPVGPWRS